MADVELKTCGRCGREPACWEPPLLTPTDEARALWYYYCGNKECPERPHIGARTKEGAALFWNAGQDALAEARKKVPT